MYSEKICVSVLTDEFRLYLEMEIYIKIHLQSDTYFKN